NDVGPIAKYIMSPLVVRDSWIELSSSKPLLRTPSRAPRTLSVPVCTLAPRSDGEAADGSGRRGRQLRLRGCRPGHAATTPFGPCHLPCPYEHRIDVRKARDTPCGAPGGDLPELIGNEERHHLWRNTG